MNGIGASSGRSAGDGAEQERGQAGGKKMKAAEILGISRKNLWEKLRLHGIAAETEPDE